MILVIMRKKFSMLTNPKDIETQERRIFLITGANSGLGYETSKFLLEKGATVIMCCRDLEKGQKAMKKLIEFNYSGNIELYELDLSDIEELRNKLQNKNLKPASVRHVLELLRRLANYAYKKKFCQG